jgi:hypothetical protein
MIPGESRIARHHPLLAPGAVLASAVAIFSYVGAVDPNESGHYPTCPFLALTGYFCPGCGSLRLIHALAHGRVGEAIGLNLFAFSMLPLLAYLWVRWTGRRARGGSRTTAADPRLIWALFAAIVVFWIVRNLPFAAVLAP